MTSDCSHVRELLPWFARGTLAPDEASVVARHLEGCSHCREDLAATRRLLWAVAQHLPADLLADYAAGCALEGWPRELIESHLASCADCREDLGDASDEPAPIALPAPVAPLDRHRVGATWRPLALAASVVALLAFGLLGVRERVGRNAAITPGVALLELSPVSLATRSAEPAPALLKRATPATLVLHSDRVTDADAYRLQLFDAAGRRLATVDGLAPDRAGGFLVHVRPDAWPAGDLRLELEASFAGRWEPFETYRFANSD